MKAFKRIGAIVLTGAMAIGMSSMAFAADMTNESGVIGEFTSPDNAVSQRNAVNLYKEITAYNPESVTVNAPTITFEYTISAGSAGKTITDAYSHHNDINGEHVNATVTTKAGVGSPTITGTAAGELAITPSDQLSASQYGTANRFDLTVDFSSIDWATAGSGAGVYRYVISETTTEATKNASGIEEGDIVNNLYMDVYVDGSGDIYGYVLFTTENDAIDASPNNDAGAAASAGKIEGFVGGPDNTVYSSDNTSVADKYYTFNITLTKDVVNDAYAESTHHQFPFAVTLDNPTVTAAVLPIMTVSSNATQSALNAAAIGTGEGKTTWNPTIADNATIDYVGIPCGTTITVKETNDVTGVIYNSVSANADTNAAAKAIGTGEDSNIATINCNATALTAASENHTAAASKVITFTNTLLQISPTGVVLRFAPYAMMLAAGLSLLLVSRRRRRLVEEA